MIMIVFPIWSSPSENSLNRSLNPKGLQPEDGWLAPSDTFIGGYVLLLASDSYLLFSSWRNGKKYTYIGP